MAEIFISFKTDDTPRVLALHDGFRTRGLTVFWSNEIPKGAPDYQAIIIREMKAAAAVVVAWTHASVTSHPVRQECAQAQEDGKLFQVVLDPVRPIEFPMEANFGAKKTMLLGWTGDPRHVEWLKLNDAIDVQLARTRHGLDRPERRVVNRFCDGIADAVTEYARKSRDLETLDARKLFANVTPQMQKVLASRLGAIMILLDELDTTICGEWFEGSEEHPDHVLFMGFMANPDQFGVVRDDGRPYAGITELRAFGCASTPPSYQD